MSWTQTDLDNLDNAIKTGVLEVEFDGKRTRFHSLREMLLLRSTMRDEIASSSGTPPDPRSSVSVIRRAGADYSVE